MNRIIRFATVSTLASFTAACLICAMSVSVASAVPVTNYNFSLPLVTGNGGYYQAGTPAGWTGVGFSSQYYENAANGGFASGTPGSLSNIQPGLSGPNYQYVADDGQGTIYQDLNVPFQNHTLYTVDISGGHRNGFDNNSTTFGLVSSNTTISNSGPATLLATAGFLNEGAMGTGTFNWASVVGSPNGQIFTFSTGAVAPSGDLEVYINNNGNSRMELGGVIVTATAITPEPSSFILCGLGVIGLFAAVRRRRKA